MKTRLAAVLVLMSALATGVANAQAPKPLRIGVEGAYPPFSQVGPDGKLTGFDIDIANALCAEMKVECTLVQQSFDGLIPALQAKKIDAIIASLSITEERAKVVAFSDKYYQTPARFVARLFSKLEMTPEGLKGKRIGVQRSTTHDRYATEQLKGAETVRYTQQDDAFLDLAAGRIDVALVDSIAASVGFLKTSVGWGYKFIGPNLTDAKYFGDGAGIAMRKADGALRNQFNAAIKSIRSNGIYKKIQDKYFDFDVYAGNVTAPADKAKK